MNLNHKDSLLFLKNPKILSDVILLKDNASIELSQMLNPPSYNLKSERKFRNKQKKKSKSKVYVSQDLSTNSELFDSQAVKMLPELKNYKFKGKKNKINTKTNLASKGSLEDIKKESHEKLVYLKDLLTVKQLSVKLDLSSAEIIKWLFLQGISVTINQALDISISTLIAENYDFTVIQDIEQSINKSNIEKQLQGKLRAPVVTILGHVDHGKTSLLKAIKSDKESIVEEGDITQCIGSYEVLLNFEDKLKKIIFLDTPGHESFFSMRQRGINITDIVILVVAADDGLKPQTIECINYIQQNDLPFLVVINKVDKPEANISLVKKQLLEYNIYDAEDNKSIVEVSTVTNTNIDLLLSSLMNLPAIQHLKSDPSQDAKGTILEAYLDKQRGTVSQLLIQNGTLHVGDIIVAGSIYGKVKAIINGLNQKVLSIESTALAEILCFASVPQVGSSFSVVKDEKGAKSLSAQDLSIDHSLGILNTRIALDDLSKNGNRRLMKQLNIIVKTDLQGSISPIIHALSQIPQEKIQINILSVASGEVSLQDIRLASTSNSIVLGFNVSASSNIFNTAERLGIILQRFNVIYDLIDYVRNHMLTFVEVEYERCILGHAKVKSLFTINRGVIAGCSISNGKLKRKSYFDIKRLNTLVYTGTIDSLKRLKDDVDEISAINDCGIGCEKYNLWQIGDELEVYDLIALEKTL